VRRSARRDAVILGRRHDVGHLAILDPRKERAESLARGFRAAGHRVTVVEPSRRAAQGVIDAVPDVLVISLGYSEPAVGAVVRSVRQALGDDVAVLVLVGTDDPDALVEADELIKEPLDPGELTLRVSNLLRAQAERRVLQRRLGELLRLHKVTWAFSLAGGPRKLFGHLARQCAEIVGAEKGLVLLFDAERRQMVGQHEAFGLSSGQVEGARYSVEGEARSRWNFRKNGPLVSNNAQADTRLLPEIAANLDLGSVLMVPLTRGPKIDGALLAADRKNGAPFTDDDLNLVLAVAGQATVAVENLRLHEELKQANDRLTEYDRLKSEFVAIVAHDFRRPLMAIRGFAELVLDEPSLPEESKQEFMRTVISETDALASLANDTLLITQIETGQLRFRWSEIDLGPFVLQQAMPLGLAEHAVLLDIPPHFPPIVADADRLRQVLTNLVSNAVKYSPHGGSISIRCRQRGEEHVVIEVVDHGLGIPKEQVGGLFQKFSRVHTDEHLRVQGTGLGLYICRLIVEGHGGQVWVESEEGQGSVFGLVLPRDASAVAPAEPPARRPPDSVTRG
ncbi:MAG TPA: ATP-binding protein, partial [Vicinamibacteria bacterium]|nr:ATP-binding protein [Vicinamibacteria bacterium]